VGVFEHADQSVFTGFTGLQYHPHVSALASFIANLCDPDPYVYLAAIPVIVALLRGRPGVALAIGAILLGANVSTELLKPLLAHPRVAHVEGVGPELLSASWPSGHATAAMSLALTCVLAAPSRVRPAVAVLGAAFAVAVSYSFLTLGWHDPSDVVGGFLVAGIWTLLGAAAVFAAAQANVGSRRAKRAASERPAAGDRRVAARVPLRVALTPPAAALLGAVGLALVVAIARPHAVVSYARAHEAFAIGATGIGALGIAIATAVMLALRQ
jgi:membrane-associated phospholipid phosphatase